MVSYDCQTHIDLMLIGLIVRGRKKVGERTMKHGEIHVDLDSPGWYSTVIYWGFEHESYRNRGYPPEIGRIFQKDIKDWWLINPLQHEPIFGGFTICWWCLFSILGHEMSRNFGRHLMGCWVIQQSVRIFKAILFFTHIWNATQRNRMGPPSDVCGFINHEISPMNYSYIYHKAT